MRSLLAMVLLLAAASARGTCVDGVCVPWLDAPKLVRTALRITPAIAAGGTLTVQNLADGRAWTFRAKSGEVAELRALALPPGMHVITVELERHRRVVRRIDVPAGDAFDAGVIVVSRMPVIRGEVRGADGKPLAAARVAARPDGAVARTDARGLFAFDVAGRWPSELLVSHSGFGTRVVSLAPVEGDVTVPTVALRKAATLRLRVTRERESDPIEAKAGLIVDGHVIWIASQTLAPGRSVATFTNLDRDVYTVLLSGSEPLQRLSVHAPVDEDEESIAVRILDRGIRGRLTLGGEPVSGATVELFHSPQWETSIITDANGAFASRAWESGPFDVVVKGGPLRAPRLAGSYGGADLRIDLPVRAIRGKVVNRDGAPVPHARVALRSHEADLTATAVSRADGDGRYGFPGLAPGRHTLRADAKGFLRADPVEIELSVEQDDAERTIVLEGAWERSIEVVDHRGQPAAAARIACAVGGRVLTIAVTDDEGRASIGTPSDEPSVLFVLSRDGFLAVAPLRPASEETATIHRISLPPPVAAVEIATLSNLGTPIPGVSLLMRFNGQLFTPEIMRELQLQRRALLRTGDDGRAVLTQLPTGFYEFWPYSTREEAEELIHSAVGVRAPIALNVVSGTNSVKVRFDARR